jgi:hypothetical protein
MNIVGATCRYIHIERESMAIIIFLEILILHIGLYVLSQMQTEYNPELEIGRLVFLILSVCLLGSMHNQYINKLEKEMTSVTVEYVKQIENVGFVTGVPMEEAYSTWKPRVEAKYGKCPNDKELRNYFEGIYGY